jgi:hypothetical protein
LGGRLWLLFPIAMFGVPICLVLIAVLAGYTGGGLFIGLVSALAVLPMLVGLAGRALTQGDRTVWPTGLLTAGLIAISWLTLGLTVDTYDSGPALIWIGFGLTTAVFLAIALTLLALADALTRGADGP